MKFFGDDPLKHMVTLGVVGAMIWGFTVGKIESKDFLPFVAMILAFWFSRNGNGQNPKV